MSNPLKKHFGETFRTWVRIAADPHEKLRGFSLVGRELLTLSDQPEQTEMEDLWGNRMPGRFWVVEAREVYRVIPELKRYSVRSEPWLFPVEFCEVFVRPAYQRGDETWRKVRG